LWEILRQVNEQAPFAVEAPKPSSLVQNTNWLALHPLGGGAKGSPITVSDGLGIRTTVRGNPAAGIWKVECMLYADPRVKVVLHQTVLQVESAVDQAGRKLVPLSFKSTRDLFPSTADASFSVMAAFEKSPDVKVMKELRGKVTADLLIAGGMMSVDLARQLASPMETPLGMATFDGGENDSYTFKLRQNSAVATPHVPNIGRDSYVTLRVNDAQKKVMQEIVSTGSPAVVRFRGHDGTRQATRVDLVFPTASLLLSMPIELKDLPVSMEREAK